MFGLSKEFFKTFNIRHTRLFPLEEASLPACSINGQHPPSGELLQEKRVLLYCHYHFAISYHYFTKYYVTLSDIPNSSRSIRFYPFDSVGYQTVIKVNGYHSIKRIIERDARQILKSL